MAKHILQSSGDELDFSLIGISCAEDQYRTAGLINDCLATDLALTSFVPFHMKEGKVFTFSLFTYDDEQNGISYELVPNTSNFDAPDVRASESGDLFSGINIDERVKLIKELPKTDYFLILKGEDISHHKFTILDRLRSIKEIIKLQMIEPKELSGARNLLF